jgi:RNA polymerase sigma-70 factor (subfamily 1)
LGKELPGIQPIVETRYTDALALIRIDELEVLSHLEFQTTDSRKTPMPQRVVGYFGRLFEEYTPFLRAVITKLMGPALYRTLEPEDVIQETLLVAATCFDDFHGEDDGEIRMWLATLARHKVVDLARHNGRLKRALKGKVSLDEPRTATGESLADQLPAELCTASMVAVKNELSGRLAKALTLIDPHEAAVLRMRYMDDMTLEEIGREIGTGRNGVRGIISRGLRNLRHILPNA